MTRASSCLAAAFLAAFATHASAQVGDFKPVTREMLVNPDAGDWLMLNRTYDEQRFSPLDQINVQTVGKLGLAWSADLDADRGVEAAPIVVDGVLYNITPWNITTAYDARTGRKLWTYDPKTDQELGKLACCDIVTRGLAA